MPTIELILWAILLISLLIGIKALLRRFKRLFVVYQLRIGKASYVGKSVSYKRRQASHLRKLEKGTHVNDYLLDEFQRLGNLTDSLEWDILYSGRSYFNSRVLRIEQRFINRYANANEATSYRGDEKTITRLTQFFIDLIF